jgi:two-component system, NarL family, nitrate/nitrite response regulator NarL
MTPVTPTVVMADDHAPTRRLVASILGGGGFDVVAEEADATAAVVAAKRHRPDVCLLDINMRGGGIEAAREITAALPGTSVVMLTVARDDDHLFEALRAGACGYLFKGSDPDVLVTSLWGVLDGEPALSPGLALRVLDQFRQDRSRRVHVPDRGTVQLSAREAEVLELLREGRSTAQIGRQLYIAPVTVRSHVAAVLKKLNAADREEAVRLFDRR